MATTITPLVALDTDQQAASINAAHEAVLAEARRVMDLVEGWTPTGKMRPVDGRAYRTEAGETHTVADLNALTSRNLRVYVETSKGVKNSQVVVDCDVPAKGSTLAVQILDSEGRLQGLIGHFGIRSIRTVIDVQLIGAINEKDLTEALSQS